MDGWAEGRKNSKCEETEKWQSDGSGTTTNFQIVGFLHSDHCTIFELWSHLVLVVLLGEKVGRGHT